RELLFERQRHGRRHGFGTGAGQARAHLDRWKIDARQIGDRQLEIGEQTEEGETDRQERSADRPADEGLGDAHEPAVCPVDFEADASTRTRDPGTRRDWPSTTTRSPGFTPDTNASSPARRATVIGRCDTASWSSTTNT